ncbi:hypothetical protein HPB50_020886 [Hyalomma asiaticum]|uniref:Uncharacterized protein n=1 Tax=Hyalomma asiaticum TaxID=266040 RepID=A0ACB7TEW3_HYAAI|nr:hypothetical protein HPB50_020886 [Hyalomma asiaticum]
MAVLLLLSDIGFRYDKQGRNTLLVERDVNVARQQNYLYEIAESRMEALKIFCHDETWVNADITVASHHDVPIQGPMTGLRKLSGKGQRRL